MTCLFNFLIALSTQGSARSGILGEGTINLASYVGSRLSSPVLLPLKKCNQGTTLQASLMIDKSLIYFPHHFVVYCNQKVGPCKNYTLWEAVAITDTHLPENYTVQLGQKLFLCIYTICYMFILLFSVCLLFFYIYFDIR